MPLVWNSDDDDLIRHELVDHTVMEPPQQEPALINIKGGTDLGVCSQQLQHMVEGT